MADDGIDDRAYGALRETFGSKGWGYKAVPENRGIVSSFQGNDLAIGFHAFVSDGMIRMAAILSFRVPAERMHDFVWSLNAINSDLPFGSFAMNPADGYGQRNFRMMPIPHFTDEEVAEWLKKNAE